MSCGIHYNLEAEPAFDRVELSWTKPDSENFEKVKIYRKVHDSEPTAFEILLFGTKVSAADTTEGEFTPMFETNGTYWTDLTVQPETTYDYKVSSISTAGIESEGITITTATLEEPTPEMGGVEDTTKENDDYKVTWSTPTEGQVKVLVGGEEYKLVDASLKTITIPKEDLEYTITGDPDVQLIPISKFGTIGEEIKPTKLFSNVNIPFTNMDLLTTGVGLLKILDPFVLLALSFMLFPRIKKFIEEAVKSKRQREV